MAVITTTLIVATSIASAVGIGFGGYGVKKTIKARKLSKLDKQRNDNNLKELESHNVRTCMMMDKLGESELKTLKSFKHFSNLLEKVHNRPRFEDLKNDLHIPKFETEQLEEVSTGAEILLGGLGGAILGTAGGFAAAGATTAAVTALGTAGTGVAISSLNGAAAVNATLAAIGGGPIAAGGGGIALGTTVLGVAAAGAAILVGGIIFSIAGKNLEKKVMAAHEQVIENEKEIKRICKYLNQLYKAAHGFYDAFSAVRKIYKGQIKKFELILKKHNNSTINWNSCTKEEQTIIENSVLLVALLYDMCKVKITVKGSSKKMKKVNQNEIDGKISLAKQFVEKYNNAA